METKLTLQPKLKLEQKLILSPQLKLVLKLIQMNSLELEEYLQQEIESNLFLEKVDGGEGEKIYENEKSLNFDEIKEVKELERKFLDDLESWESEKRARCEVSEEDEEEFSPLELITRSEGLMEHLLWQLRMSDLDKDEMEIGIEIIGNLNEDGYLTVSPEELAQKFNVPIEKVEKVRFKIQEFDPVGVASRDIRECFLVQLKHRGVQDEVCYKMVKDYFSLLLKKDIKKIAEALNVEQEKVKEAYEILKNICDPKPGKYYSSYNVEYVFPDLRVIKIGDEYDVELTRQKTPYVRISKNYLQFLSSKRKDPEVVKFIKENYERAKYLVKCLLQRNETLLRVGRAIVKHQKEFFQKGPEYMRPLILKEIADYVGLHISTVSRVVKNKWIDTEWGIFPLKYFFSSKLEGEMHNRFHSSTGVKEKIKKLISEEDPDNPLSDVEISRRLYALYGIKVARRTVAKYRDEMKILSSSQRKRHRSSGSSTLTAFILILLLAGIIYGAAKISRPYFHYYSIKGDVKEAMREVLKYTDPEETRRYVIQRLNMWNISYDPSKIRIYDEEGKRYFEMEYAEPVTFFGKFTILFTFHPSIYLEFR